MLTDPSLSGAHTSTKGRILAFMLSGLLEQKMLGTTPMDSDVDRIRIGCGHRSGQPSIFTRDWTVYFRLTLTLFYLSCIPFAPLVYRIPPLPPLTLRVLSRNGSF